MLTTKTPLCLFIAVVIPILASAAELASKKPLTGKSYSGLSDEDQKRANQAASYVIEAILIAPDMTFKMPVLEAAFNDTPDWEQRLQQIIRRESWGFAKVHFIHLYWRRVSKKDASFMGEMLAYVREYQRTDDTLGIVDEMLDPKGASDKTPALNPAR